MAELRAGRALGALAAGRVFALLSHAAFAQLLARLRGPGKDAAHGP